jgi:Rieske Fe-S protein
MTAETTTRRTVLTTGAAVAGAAAGTVALAACSSGGQSSGSSPGDGSGGTSTVTTTPGTVVTALSAVGVGGAASVTIGGQPAIVARPTDTDAVAFSAICTHQGCTVAPSGSRLNCPCHGSVFNALTGAVEHGPAQSPLPPIPVKVENGNVVTA